jgi:Zn-dependent peptidase ImmA (M78 family)/DNA-binding XRE family transcriptional regulator
MVVRTPIHGQTLSWARNVLGAEIGDFASSLNVSVQQVEKWENEELAPTLNQLRTIAKKLDRTPAFFFVPPPGESGIPATPDFRGRQDEHLPSALLKEIKRAETYRRSFLDLSPEPNELTIQPFGWNELKDRAQEVRQLLLDDTVDPLVGLSPNQVVTYWRTVVEDLGILVFQTTGIDVATFRGLSVHHDHLPIVLLNGADANYAKVFTLLHELGHLINRASGVCLVLDNSQAEALCNAFAAEVLMPGTQVQRLLRAISREEQAATLAQTFKVSELAAAVRLKTLGLIDQETLESIRVLSDERWAATRRAQNQRDGFVPHWRLRYRDLGPKYVVTVIRALENDRIDSLDACYMLQTRVPTLMKMQEELHRTGEV